ncbi:LmeA family phospholipid-binding protein [Anthocerotibacter panamensis]|uniref:LmeA family phospholipid-binding protein n=1 Tax=Anthocerotibacter panamensis TaxID=2857077 RepID=UPI001C401692|nr:DUF2993 domain-containing protein [Anthocerotibacter panamensis]
MTPQRGICSNGEMFGQPFSLTTELLSSLTTLGLKTCLAGHETVSVRIVSKNFLHLLTGGVDEVEVHGKGWQSPRGVTCRAIAVRTGALMVDVRAVLSGKIVLKNPAPASAQLALNRQDFNNFLKSPLLDKSLNRLVVEGEPVTDLHAERMEEGTLWVSGQWGSERPDFELQAGRDGKAVVTRGHARLSQSLQEFFNNMVIDLHGLELRMDSFAVRDTLLHLQAQGNLWQFPDRAFNF